MPTTPSAVPARSRPTRPTTSPVWLPDPVGAGSCGGAGMGCLVGAVGCTMRWGATVGGGGGIDGAVPEVGRETDGEVAEPGTPEVGREIDGAVFEPGTPDEGRTGASGWAGGRCGSNGWTSRSNPGPV